MAGQQIRADIAHSSPHTLRDTRTRRYHGEFVFGAVSAVVMSSRQAGAELPVGLFVGTDADLMLCRMTQAQATSLARALIAATGAEA